MIISSISSMKYNEDFNFYSYGYKTRTRIDKCAQMCIHTTANVIKDSNNNPEKIGLITVTKFGCTDSRDSYLKQLNSLSDKRFASPKDFVQSINNIPNSMATIENNIMGFTNNFIGDSESTLIALWQAVYVIKNDIADKMIVTAFDNDICASLKIEKQTDLKKGLKIVEFDLQKKFSLKVNIINSLNCKSLIKIDVKKNSLAPDLILKLESLLKRRAYDE